MRKAALVKGLPFLFLGVREVKGVITPLRFVRS